MDRNIKETLEAYMMKFYKIKKHDLLFSYDERLKQITVIDASGFFGEFKFQIHNGNVLKSISGERLL